MGLGAASHFIVNVGSRFERAYRLITTQLLSCMRHADTITSHRSRTQCICDHKGELLLCVRGMQCILLGDRVLLFPVRLCFLSSCHLIVLLTRRNCSETKQKSLEEIAAAFGDKVVLLTDTQVASPSLAASKSLKPELEQLEVATSMK